MRIFPSISISAAGLLALTLSVGCGGNSDTNKSNAQKEQRAGTKIDKDGNSIFNGEGGKKDEPSKRRRRATPKTGDEDVANDTPDANAPTDTDAATDATADIAGDMPGGDSTNVDVAPTTDGADAKPEVTTPNADTVAKAKAEKEAAAAKELAAKEAAAKEAAKKKAKEQAQKAAKAAKNRDKAAADSAKRKKAVAARKAKAKRRAAAKKKREAEKARKAQAKKDAENPTVAKTEAELAEEKELARVEDERLAKEMSEAKAAASAIRRAEAEAASKAERERQAREMARIGEGVNKECPYVTLEAVAETGKLTTDNVNCLESSLDKASMGVDRANISMVLITNAHAKGDVEEWEKYIEQHLLVVERENPALAYRYALHLFEKGPGESQATYRWTGVALKSRSAWAGEAYTDRVNAIYKLRAAAAQSLWKQSIEALESFPGSENENRVKTQRYLTRNVAKEWYEFAANHEQDPTMAKRLCNIASLDDEYCLLEEDAEQN